MAEDGDRETPGNNYVCRAPPVLGDYMGYFTHMLSTAPSGNQNSERLANLLKATETARPHVGLTAETLFRLSAAQGAGHPGRPGI